MTAATLQYCLFQTSWTTMIALIELGIWVDGYEVCFLDIPDWNVYKINVSLWDSDIVFETVTFSILREAFPLIEICC